VQIQSFCSLLQNKTQKSASVNLHVLKISMSGSVSRSDGKAFSVFDVTFIKHNKR